MADSSPNSTSRPFTPNDAYDIIFCGGGTSACVAAGRLAAADPSLQILIIERGKSNLGDAQINNPLLMLANMAPGSKAMIWYHAEAEENLNNKPRVLSTGGVLGGGSSVNAMMYSRAQKIDFENFGMAGWGWEDCLRCAKKLETVHMYGKGIDESIHGNAGPINISYSTHVPMGPVDDFLDAVRSFDGAVAEDLQNFETGNAWSKGAKYIGTDGVRQDTASQYIHPLMADGKHTNLHVLTENLVSKILFEGNKAVGVEFEPEPIFLQQDLGMTKRTTRAIRAKKLVVVSAGVMGTPLILERSGVGNESRLSNLGINVVSRLPGVGENYQDHHFVLPGYQADLGPKETLDEVLTGRYDVPSALASRDPFLGWNAVDVWGKLRMTPAEVEALGPDFKKAWDRDFADKPTKPIMMMGIINSLMADRRTLPESDQDARFITMATYTAYPYSRGSIHIKSPDVLVAPQLKTGFLSDKDGIDLKMSVWAYKKGRDLYRRTNAFVKEVSIAHPNFKENSLASLSEAPLRSSKFTSVDDRKKISAVQYDEDDDRAIEQFVRDNVMSTWHGLGTCKMGLQSKGGVVDGSLNVYGTTNLKCVDLSVIPENVGSNTANMAMIVGERAAEIISMELER